MFKGSFVALVTPFKKGKLDEAKLKNLVEFHIKARTDGLVPCGSTGESATLTHEEHRKVIEIVVKTAAGRLPVIAGAGSNATAEGIDLVRHAYKVKAQGALLIVPYYNKPTPMGLFEHFRTLANETPLPLVLYNIPGRTGVNMPPEIVVKLAKACPTIVGLKEASGNIDYTSQVIAELGRDNFSVLSGDDSLTLPLMSIGAQGVISVIGNILPQAMGELCRAALHGHYDRAREIHTQMFPVMRALFVETNPIPIKAAMAKLGMCSDEMRLPLVRLGQGPRKRLNEAIRNCPLLKRSRS